MKATIRPARSDDYEGICALLSGVDALHRAALPEVFCEPDGPARTREYVSQLLADDEVALLVAEEKGELVGLVHVLKRKSRPIPLLVRRRFAVIDTLVVAEKCRRRGVGRALMGAAHQWARWRGLDRVELTVWEFNRAAVAFYESLGYTTARRKMWQQIP